MARECLTKCFMWSLRRVRRFRHAQPDREMAVVLNNSPVLRDEENIRHIRYHRESFFAGPSYLGTNTATNPSPKHSLTGNMRVGAIKRATNGHCPIAMLMPSINME